MVVRDGRDSGYEEAASALTLGGLLQAAWQAYRRRGLKLLWGIFLVQLAGAVLLTGYGAAGALALGGVRAAVTRIGQGDLPPQFFVLLGGLFVLGMLVSLWQQTVIGLLVVAPQEPMGALWRTGLRRMWSVGWVLFLASSVTMAGSLLFLVPGLVLGVQCSLAMFALLDQDYRGLDALLASRALLRGRFWRAFLWYLVLLLGAMALAMVPTIGGLLSFLAMPFGLLALWVFYQTLMAEDGAPDIGDARRWAWVTMATVGAMLPLLGMIGALGTGQWRCRVQAPSTPPAPVAPTPDREPQEAQVPAQASWRLPQPSGEVTGPLTLKALRIEAGDGGLLLRFDLAGALDEAFAATASRRGLAVLARVYLDTDLDRATGLALTDRRSGYDLELVLALERQDGGRAHLTVLQHEDGVASVLHGRGLEPRVRARERGIDVQVPWLLLALVPEGRVRACFQAALPGQAWWLGPDKEFALDR